jgi:hypothetical protein
MKQPLAIGSIVALTAPLILQPAFAASDNKSADADGESNVKITGEHYMSPDPLPDDSAKEDEPKTSSNTEGQPDREGTQTDGG